MFNIGDMIEREYFVNVYKVLNIDNDKLTVLCLNKQNVITVSLEYACKYYTITNKILSLTNITHCVNID